MHRSIAVGISNRNTLNGVQNLNLRPIGLYFDLPVTITILSVRCTWKQIPYPIISIICCTMPQAGRFSLSIDFRPGTICMLPIHSAYRLSEADTEKIELQFHNEKRLRCH